MSTEISNVGGPAQALASSPKTALHVPKAPVVQAKQTTALQPAVQVNPEEMRKNLEEAISRLNEQVERNGRGLNFAVDERLNRPVITVRSTASGEIVRQIPNEVVIKVAHSIEDIKGLLMDQRG